MSVCSPRDMPLIGDINLNGLPQSTIQTDHLNGQTKLVGRRAKSVDQIRPYPAARGA